MAFTPYPTNQNGLIAGGLEGAMSVLQQPQIDQANQMQNQLAQAQMEEARARTGLYDAQSANMPTAAEKYAAGIAKAKEETLNDARAKDYALMQSVKMAGSPDAQAEQFSNIASSLTPTTFQMFAAPGKVSDDGKMGFKFNPDTLDIAINTVAAQHPTLSKVLNTNTRTEANTNIGAGHDAAKKYAADAAVMRAVDVAEVRAEAAKAAKVGSQQLLTSYMAQTGKLHSSYSIAMSAAAKLKLMDAEAGAAAEASAQANFEKGKADIDKIFQEHSAPVNPSQVTKPQVSPEDFNTKWATLQSGQTLVGPDGKTYTKK